jgi:hypothetical protein
MRFYQRYLRVLVLLCCTLAPIGGCAIRRVATTAELDQLGTRKYTNHGREEVIKATVTALRIQGYEVVTTDPRIRTAPRDVATTAFGNAHSAQSFTEAVAWDIDVEGDTSSATLHAVPRATLNGQPMEELYYEWAERTFRELLREIDQNLSSKSAARATGARG